MTDEKKTRTVSEITRKAREMTKLHRAKLAAEEKLRIAVAWRDKAEAACIRLLAECDEAKEAYTEATQQHG